MSPFVDFVLRATALMVVGLVAWKLARHKAAESRSTLLRVTFASLGVLPLALFLVPKWQPIVPWVAEPEPIYIDPTLLTAAQGYAVEPASPIPWGWIVWLTVGVAVLVPAVLGWASLRRIWIHGDRPDAQLSLELIKALETLGVHKPVRVRLGDTKTPLVFGVRHPHVLLPRGFGDWPEAHRRSALMHEAAHIRRFDCAWLAFAGVVRAIYACHPLVWWLSRALRDETELAADERAIRSGVEATDYATALVAIARDLQRPGRLVHSQGVTFMNHRQLDRRVRGALASRRRGFTVIGSLGLLASAIATVFGISAVQPRLPEQEFFVAQDDMSAPTPAPYDSPGELLEPLDMTVQVAQVKTKQKAKPGQKPKKASSSAKLKAVAAPKAYVVTRGSDGKLVYKLAPGSAAPKVQGTYHLTYSLAPVAGRPRYYQAAPKVAIPVAGRPKTVQGVATAPDAALPSHYKVVGQPAMPAKAPSRVAVIAQPGAPMPSSAATIAPKADTVYFPQGATAPARAADGAPMLRDLPMLGHLYAPSAQSPEETKKAREIIEKLLQGAKGKPEEEDLKRLLELMSKVRAEAAKATDLAVTGKLTTERARLMELYGTKVADGALARTRAIRLDESARKLAVERSMLATRALTARPEIRLDGLSLARTLSTRVGQSDGIIEIVITDEKGKKQVIKVRQDQVKKTITLQRGKDGKIRVIDK